MSSVLWRAVPLGAEPTEIRNSLRRMPLVPLLPSSQLRCRLTSEVGLCFSILGETVAARRADRYPRKARFWVGSNRNFLQIRPGPSCSRADLGRAVTPGLPSEARPRPGDPSLGFRCRPRRRQASVSSADFTNVAGACGTGLNLPAVLGEAPTRPVRVRRRSTRGSGRRFEKGTRTGVSRVHGSHSGSPGWEGDPMAVPSGSVCQRALFRGPEGGNDRDPRPGGGGTDAGRGTRAT